MMVKKYDFGRQFFVEIDVISDRKECHLIVHRWLEEHWKERMLECLGWKEKYSRSLLKHGTDITYEVYVTAE